MHINYIATLAAAILAASTQAAPLNEVQYNTQVQARDVVGSSYSGSSQASFASHRREAEDDASTIKKLSRRALGIEKRDEPMYGTQRRFKAARRDTAKCKAKTTTMKITSTSTKTSTTSKATSTSTSKASSTKASTTSMKASTTSTKASTPSTKASTTSTKATSTTSSQAASTASSNVDTSTSGRGITKVKNTGGVVGGYYPNWISDSFPPENIYWPQFDYVAYAFATVDNGAVTIDDSALLKRFVAAAHAGSTKAILSIGGWGQSGGYSDAVVSASARLTLVASVNAVIKAYNLDGVDFDWEYPGNVEGGTSRGLDTKNFQTFLQDMRNHITTNKIMSAAVPQQVWQGSNGNPVGSVARAGAALDYLMIMNYDVWGSSSTPGPNAPLANFCGNSTQPVASAAGGVKAWTDASFPREKILLGVPSYGYISTSTKTKLIQRDLASQDFPLKINEHQMYRRGSGLTSMSGTTGSGQINFNALVSQGALQYDSDSGEYVQGSGWTKYWDDCSDTPYLSNGNYVVTYDDPDSLYDKADFARLAGIAGVSMWSLDGDTTSRSLYKGLIAGLASSS